ncbi:shikimate kinase [Dehalogenimonas formicexedens]|uniref:Shikimate kinase n=1 Tax=Dehalogenimonas formicexedens TaxID=1839801 RepID=A0A1P8F4Y5_9CHLR|nr:shikimate kinase [Dehalogenimonas formicexedens]APV43544.1 shikimate kinase [Dehalogenimonas formicexedens]
MKSNISLIGFMGSGKSTVGKRLARRLERDFIETDRLIEERAGMPVGDIFQERGETWFRDAEQEVIKGISDSAQNAVIACGGGAVIRQANIEQLKRCSVVVYLETPIPALKERLASSRKRPLLNRPDRDTVIEELHEARRPVYEAAADVTVKTGKRPFAAVISEIIDRLGIDESDRH